MDLNLAEIRLKSRGEKAALPSPLRGGVGGGGHLTGQHRSLGTPLPDPPPHGGREPREPVQASIGHHPPQPFFTALTIFCAASSRLSAGTTLRPESRMIFLPCSTLVPSSRTTSGTLRPTCFTAATTPSAMTSHFMMPPKILTSMPFTLGSAVMILNAAATFSLLALPPTSRKFAGAMP